MSLITTFTRTWLTRSFKPFLFENEYDSHLPFRDCDKLGLYVHIPFCKSICTFCPYCKTIYNKELCDKYIDALIQEIRMVGSQYDGKKETTSLYFGGGTPALVADRIGEIIEVINEYFIVTEGVGVELHPDNVTVETLGKLKAAGVTKISIGIQSFSEKFQTVLGRKQVDPAKLKEAKYSSMTRDNFLGFGCSATTLLKNQFKINTFSVDEYCKRINGGELPTSLTIRFSLRQRMVYYLFWTLYSMQLDERKFEQFFGVPLKKMYGFEFWLAQKLGFLTKENNIYSMTTKGAFYYHYYEQFYTLSYIDKMWGIMRNEAFPKYIKM